MEDRESSAAFGVRENTAPETSSSLDVFPSADMMIFPRDSLVPEMVTKPLKPCTNPSDSVPTIDNEVFSDCHFLSNEKASLLDTSIFLFAIDAFGIRKAVSLAVSLRWKLPAPIPNLIADVIDLVHDANE